jgi:hypothetical protein
MSTAKAHGPARSPTVLDTCSPDSANAEAHWHTACSEAPAQSMSSMSSQNARRRTSCRSGIAGVSSPVSEPIGTVRKKTPFAAGSAAQRSASVRQCAMPASRKKSVEASTTNTSPQQ